MTPAGGGALGRKVNHDERSRSYAITPASAETLVSVKHKRLVKPYDQGHVSSCTGNAAAGVLSTAPFHHRFGQRTALRLYARATQLDPFPGTYPAQDTGSDGLSVAKAAKERGWISAYFHAFGLPAALTALQTTAVITGITWKTGCDSVSPEGQITWSGTVRGGHEFQVDEIDVERQRVWLTNSWGPDWGLNGRAWFTWDDWGAALLDSGDVTVLLP